MTAVIKHLHFLPIIVFIWFPTTFVLTYVIAVVLKDVVPVFPYISDTGTFSPESCIFGQLLNTGSILMGLFMYIRYRQVQEIYGRAEEVRKSLVKLNTVCLWLGLIAAFGVSVVGNFQESNMFTVHLIGAGMAFGLGGVYIILQTIVSLRIYPAFGHKTVNHVRIVISIICAVASASTFLFAAISLFQFSGVDMTKWTAKDGGYHYHLISTVSEWITAIFTMGYVLTFTNDFKKITLYEPEIKVVDNYVKENSVCSIDRF